jgi:hypothetical protein
MRFGHAAVHRLNFSSLFNTSSFLLCFSDPFYSDLSMAVLSSQQTPLQKELTEALQQRDLASQRFLKLHQHVATP